jgi:hypothetical protein
VQPGDAKAEDLFSSTMFYFVFPVNDAAVSVLGPDLVAIRESDLTRIDGDAILDAARKKKLP